jgi:hypothetical protein
MMEGSTTMRRLVVLDGIRMAGVMFGRIRMVRIINCQ